MTKCIRDGKVAILYSPGYGSGWSTAEEGKQRDFLLFDKRIVELVEDKRFDEVKKYVDSVYPDEFYLEGADQLEIMWVPLGTEFRVEEYDGSEYIQLNHRDYWSVA